MAEVGVDTETGKRGEPVKLRDASIPNENAVRLGQSYKSSGATFELRNVYGRGADQLGGDKLSEVYFRTSDNVYMLDDQGNLLNADLSARTGKAQGVKFGKEKLTDVKMVVGEPFLGGMTTGITEIVAMTERLYPIDQHAGTKSSTILEDFQRKVPPKKLGDWQNDPLTGEKLLKTSLPDNLKPLSASK